MPAPVFHSIYGAANPMPRLIKDHVTANCAIERDDFDCSPFPDRGGLQKAWGLFSVSNSNSSGQNNELDSLLAEINQELIA